MLSNKKLNKMKHNVGELNVATGATDAQVAWVKDKVAQIKSWKDQAIIKLDQIETWKDVAVDNFIEIDARLTALENKAAQFQTAMINLAARVKALEDAH